MESKFQLSDSTVEFKIKSIPVLGNIETGSLIGLSEVGINLITKIKSENIFLDKLKSDERELFDILLENNFIRNNAVCSENYSLNSAYVHVTNHCNLNCLGCYSLDKKRNMGNDLKTEDVKIILRELRSEGINNIVISGGEPFLRRDLEKILKFAKQDCKFEKISVITNGVVITEDKIKETKPYIDDIAVSVDGFDEKHSTFIRDKDILPKIINGIDIIKNNDIDLSILPTIHKKNVSFVDNYVEWAKKMNVGISFSIFSAGDDFNEFLLDNEDLINLSNYITQSEKKIEIKDTVFNYTINIGKSCGICETLISVAANGDVYPCHMLHAPKFKIGNLLKESFTELKNKSKWKKYNSLHVDNFETCGSCEYKYLCSGGCRARSYFQYNKLTSKDSFCTMNKIYFDKLTNTLCKHYKKEKL